MMPLPLVLASNNPGKLAELRSLFEGLPIELQGQGTLGIPEAEEPHATFVENALAKARQAAAASGCAAMADDSGLCVEALGGAPGVASAHFAALGGEPTETARGMVAAANGPETVAASPRERLRLRQDAANNALLLQRLAGCEDRRAAFVSTLVALRHADDPQPLIAFGRWRCEILHEPRGRGGFGYDPIVLVPELGRSVAELATEEKNRFSHRALAAREMRALMRAHWFPQAGP